MTEKELNRRIAKALGWSDLHWEDGYSKATEFGHVTSLSGWRGHGPNGENAFFADSTLLNAWSNQDYLTIETMIRIAKLADRARRNAIAGKGGDER